MAGAEADGSNAAQSEYWNADAGASWAALQERLDRQLESLGTLAMDALAPSPDERVIDVGCGCGQTTLALARRVGAGGGVLGVDISAPMLAVARRRTAQAGAAAARFVEADAQTHPFDPAGADAVFSRFGVMFFADPAAAFANLRAALVPGGRLAFVCWRSVELNPFMTLPFLAALPHLATPPEPPDPAAPGPFAFADEGRVRGILAEAGFGGIEMTPHDQPIGSGGIEETLEVALGIGPLGRALRAAPQETGAVKAAVRAVLEPHLTQAGVLLPSASWIVRARNP